MNEPKQQDAQFIEARKFQQSEICVPQQQPKKPGFWSKLGAAVGNAIGQWKFGG